MAIKDWVTQFPTDLDTVTEMPVIVNFVDKSRASQINTVGEVIQQIETMIGSDHIEVGSIRYRVGELEDGYNYVISVLGTAGGDLSGSYPDPTVVGIQGRDVESAAPTDGYALTWDAGSSTWISDKPIPGGTAAGDLTGTYPRPTVAKIRNRTVSTVTPIDGYALVWWDSISQWRSAQAVPGGIAGGDLSGTYPRPTVAKIRGQSVSSNVPTDDYGLTWNDGASRWESSKPIPGGVAAGDLSGTYPKPTVAKIQGRNIATTVPTDGYTLSWNDGLSRWEPAPRDLPAAHLLGGSEHTADTLANLNTKVSDADLISDITSAGGDLSGTYPNPTVAKLQTRSVEVGAPTDGYALTWDSGSSTWISDKPIPGRDAGGDLRGSYPNPGVSGLQGREVSSAVPTNGYALTWNDGAVQWIPDKPIPGGPAGGDLSGTYPNPTVAKIQGYDVATTAPQDGYALVYESSTAKWTPEPHIKYGVFTGADVDSYGLSVPTSDTLALWSGKNSGSGNVSVEMVANVNSATIDADHKIAAFYWRDNVGVKHEALSVLDGEIHLNSSTIASIFSDQADGGSSIAITLGSENSFVTPGAKLLSIMNGGLTGLERSYIDYRGDFCINKLDNAQSLNIKSLSELTTIASAADGYSVIQIPANSIVVAVSIRVTTVIPTATTFSVGVVGGITRYGYNVSTAAGTTSYGTNDALRYYAVATSILFKPDVTPAAATGRVRTTIHFIEIAPPTS